MIRQNNLLESRKGRFLTFGLLYISEGIPYGFTSTAMGIQVGVGATHSLIPFLRNREEEPGLTVLRGES